MFKYAGIGSRETPNDIGVLMYDLALYLATEHNATLVSGGARGADSFFELGCDDAGGRKEIWLPEPGFNRRQSDLLPSKDAFLIAPRYVEHWKKCNDWAKAAHARNCHQVLGADLLSPVRFVICWTVGGKTVGGTATAIKVAMDYGVPVLNLGLQKVWKPDEIEDFLSRYIP